MYALLSNARIISIYFNCCSDTISLYDIVSVSACKCIKTASFKVILSYLKIKSMDFI